MIAFSKLLTLLPLLPFVFGAPVEVAKRSVPSGFPYAEGTKFMLDGEPFCFGGMNAYWIPQLVTDAQYTQAFDMLKDLNAKVLRTWAFSMVETVPTNSLTYYQLWDGDSFTVNTGANGLERMDKTVAMAEKYNIKLILAFTNNWDDYGGMDTYTKHTMGSLEYHSDFYVQAAPIAAYESYVQTIVNRYKDSPAIFAWELANEERGSGWPSTARPGFSASDLTKWIKDRSAFVKSLDPNHMVAVGDEGYYNWANSTDYIYDGDSSLDFDANLQLPNIDFGTFHLYPQSWGETPTLEWGNTYIEQHANSMNQIGKPVLFEEFNLEGWPEQLTTMTAWIEKAKEVGLPGIMPRGLGAQDMDISGTTVYYNGNVGNLSGMDIYPSKTELWDVLKAMGQWMPANCGGTTTPVTSTASPVSSTSTPETTTAAPTSSDPVTATPSDPVTSTDSCSAAPATSTTASSCAVSKWGQCGGVSYTGCTTCESGSTCTYGNDWWSQCL